MRVLVVGAGAIGGYFGGRMLEAGRDVTFLVRPRRRAQLRKDGLVVDSPLGDIRCPAPTVAAEEINHPWDLILLACKAYDLAGAIDSLAPAVGPDSMILPLLNGMAHLDVLDQRFGARAVLGGLCSLAVTLTDDGTVRHLSKSHDFAFGDRTGDVGRNEAISQLMAPVAVRWHASTDIIQEMWEKWVFLAALAAATCLMRGSVGQILAAGGEATLTAMLAETDSVAAAAGHAARPDALGAARRMLTMPGSTLAASMLRDVEKGGRVEVDHVIIDLIRRGKAAGCVLPLLDLAALHLKTYEARRDSAAAAA